MTAAEIQSIMGGRTVRANPSRRRRRRSRRGHRRAHRRYGHRRYRRNPGGEVIGFLKQAVPVLLSMFGTGAAVNFVGPMIPGVASLGSLQGPVLSTAAFLGAGFATKKVAFLAKHRGAIMMGAGLNAFLSIIKAFAPANVKALVGMGVGDYVQMGDYIAVGGAPPLREDFTLSDYIAVGGDGVSEELGMGVEEELGAVEEELGNDLLGGMPGGASLLKPVPSQKFVMPIPARSFTKQIPAATTSYDNPSQVYTGIFGGGFGR
jgi:hypothetical protein